MKMIKYLFVFLLVIFTVFSCQEDEIIEQAQPAQFTDILLSLTEIEYAFYIEDANYASSLLENLDEVMTSCDKAICASGQDDLIDIAEEIQYLQTNSSSSDINHLLDKLRTIKGMVMNLETRDDYDPYIYMMWQYEEDMYYATKAAMDPMLDLYEWGEFVNMIVCMNDKWERITYHYPSSETLDGDQGHYRNQISKKIILDRSMKQLNYVVFTDDAPDYSICETAETLRKSYINYLRAFLMIDDSTSVYLAII